MVSPSWRRFERVQTGLLIMYSCKEWVQIGLLIMYPCGKEIEKKLYISLNFLAELIAISFDLW